MRGLGEIEQKNILQHNWLAAGMVGACVSLLSAAILVWFGWALLGGLSPEARAIVFLGGAGLGLSAGLLAAARTIVEMQRLAPHLPDILARLVFAVLIVVLGGLLLLPMVINGG